MYSTILDSYQDESTEKFMLLVHRQENNIQNSPLPESIEAALSHWTCLLDLYCINEETVKLCKYMQKQKQTEDVS